MILLDASFLVNAKKTDLHKHLHEIFEDIRITPQIEEEIVVQGLKYQKVDAILTQEQINQKKIIIEAVSSKEIQTIEKVLHLGEASLIPIINRLKEEEVVVGTDDRPFCRYLKYVYPLIFKKTVSTFSTLDLVIVLTQKRFVTREVAKDLLQQLERVGAHGPLEIMEGYYMIENVEEESDGRRKP